MGMKLTPCYLQHSLAFTDRKLTLCHSRYNQASEINERGHDVPLCATDGSYKPTQCNSATGECWCVDAEGREMPETRKVGELNCESKGVFYSCQFYKKVFLWYTLVLY